MSYQVIARKYRPQRFADVVGQEHVTQTLANAIQQNRIAHAYLFVGPRGTGKTTIARIFAKCLNCVGGPMVDFAVDDPRCQEITEGRSLDVLEIDGASNRGIEEIRVLRETVKYSPSVCRFKVYIIDEVHMLTKEAFNALLKTLEEPPAHVKFMFATTEPEKVLATILSRCQRYDLRRIPVALIMEHLALIANLEKVKIEEAALFAVARGAEGCMRDAESTLDQLISFCGNAIVEIDVLSMFGLTARGQVHALAGAIIAGDQDATLRSLNELARNGKDLGRLLSDLLSHFRNLLLFKVGKGDLSLLEVTETEAATLKAQSTAIHPEGLVRMMEVLTECESRYREAVSKKILIEIGLIKAIQVRQAVSLDSVLKQLVELRSGSTVTTGPAPFAAPLVMQESIVKPPPAPLIKAPVETAPQISIPSEPILPIPEMAAPTAAPASSELELLWARILDAVGRVSQFTRSYLLLAHPLSLMDRVLTIGFAPENVDQLDLVDNKKNRELIQRKIAEMNCGDVQVKFVKAPPPKDRGMVPAAVEPPVEPDPLAPVPSLKASPASVPPVPAPAPVPVSTVNQAAKTAPAKAPAPKPSKPIKAATTAKDAVPGTPEEPKAAKPALVQLNKDEFKNDPLIKQALEIFKGQIVEVLGPPKV